MLSEITAPSQIYTCFSIGAMNQVKCCYLSPCIGKNGFFPSPSLFIVEKSNTFHTGFTFFKCRSPSSSGIIWYRVLNLTTVSKGGWQLSRAVLQWVRYMGAPISLHLLREGRRETGNVNPVHIYMHVNDHFYAHT